LCINVELKDTILKTHPVPRLSNILTVSPAK
jgi:hypothetical protein